jgi:putative ABC transport system substrate-binding protein
MRLIGFLEPISATAPGAKEREAAFMEGLEQLGWTPGRNVRIETRWSGGDAAQTRKNAADLVAMAPDVIVTGGSAGMDAMRQATRTIPVVFAIVPDPVGSGYVASLSHPGGNATGFVMFEYSLTGKWLELLKEIAPDVTRAAVLRDPAIAAGIGKFAVLQSVAPSVDIDVSPIDLGDPSQIVPAIAAFAQSPNSGMIVTASAITAAHIGDIIAAAAHNRLPAIYVQQAYVVAGGLISYGPDFPDQYRRAASYVDRVLKGAKPSDLPVQAPTKYELVVNLKTAKALGLNVPSSLLARADEVIE